MSPASMYYRIKGLGELQKYLDAHGYRVIGFRDPKLGEMYISPGAGPMTLQPAQTHHGFNWRPGDPRIIVTEVIQ